MPGGRYRRRRVAGALSHVPSRAFRLGTLILIPFRRVPAVTGGPPLQGVLLLYPFGTKEGPNCASLAMYPLVCFVSQAERYVSKEQRVLSDAPSGQFSEPLARRLPEICGGIFPSVSF